MFLLSMLLLFLDSSRSLLSGVPTLLCLLRRLCCRCASEGTATTLLAWLWLAREAFLGFLLGELFSGWFDPLACLSEFVRSIAASLLCFGERGDMGDRVASMLSAAFIDLSICSFSVRIWVAISCCFKIWARFGFESSGKWCMI